MKILCTGDLHIGRRPTGIPAHVDTRPLAPSQCWLEIVERAVEDRVDVVALTGDVVDRSNRFFEAYGPLERGLRRLAAAGIHTVAVAGNHDFDVLPRLAGSVGTERFHLLGHGGVWERWTLTRGGEPALHVDGWSFPSPHYPGDPLQAYIPDESGGVPVIGMLHADLDQPRSDYAPVDLGVLQRAPVRLWLLGHVHRPMLHRDPGSPPVLYPGSPQALSRGETGRHGAWSVVIRSRQAPDVTLVPLSRVCYEIIDVDVSDVADPTELDRCVSEAVHRTLNAVAASEAAPRYLSCRLRLTGRTPVHGQIESRLTALCHDLEIQSGGVTAFAELAGVDTRPAIDLEALAGGAGPVAILARLLLALDDGELAPDHHKLLADLHTRAASVRSARPYLHVSDDDDGAADRPPLEHELRQQGFLLLDTLLAQEAG